MTPPGDPVPARLSGAIAAVAGRARPFGERLVYLEETGSTNDVAGRLASAGAPEGTLVVAAAQTRGRGRHGRTWFSPPGSGLYFSLVFRPAGPDALGVTPLLTLAAGVGVAEGIERATGVRADLKWPNDLVVVAGEPGAPGERRKLAGILAEGAVSGGRVQHVVLGVGINVRDTAYPPELAGRVTAIARETGRDPEPFDVLASCVAAIAARWRQMLDGDVAGVLAAWRRRAPSSRGARVRVSTAEGPMTGTTAGLNRDGALMVDVGGRVVDVVAGEVEWL